MRKLISYPAEPPLAQKLHAWLAVNQIDARCKQAGEQWEIWVLDEDQLPLARELAATFNDNPDDAQFDTVLNEANKIELEKDKLQRARKKEANKLERQQQRHSVRPTKSLTRSIIILCSLLFGASLVFQSGDDGNFIHESLGVVRANSVNESYGERIRLLQRLDGGSVGEAQKNVDKILNSSYNSLLLEDIKRGQLWRMVTPIFLHAPGASLSSFLHIFFNMYWLFALGLGMERHFGTGNFALLVLFTGVISILLPAISPTGGIFGLTALKGAPVVGFSGVIYGIIGFGWIKMKMQPHLGIIIPPFVFIFMMIWLGIGLVSPEGGFFGAISHLAHAAGLLAGVAFGYVHTQLGH
jgi:GlpG protein